MPPYRSAPERYSLSHELDWKRSADFSSFISLHSFSGCQVQENADAFWAIYRDDNVKDRTYPQHLLPYPYHVDPSSGAVSPLGPPFDCFLDTKAPVAGTNRSNMLPVMVKKKLIA